MNRKRRVSRKRRMSRKRRPNYFKITLLVDSLCIAMKDALKGPKTVKWWDYSLGLPCVTKLKTTPTV